MIFQDRVLLNESKLNDTDDQIIEFINKNIDKFLNQSIQDTAKELFTVPNTIVRLSKKLGYAGFSELKFALRQEKDNPLDLTNKPTLKYLAPSYENIVETLKIINIDSVKKSIKKIKDSKRIYVLGSGDSLYFCEMFVKNMRCISIDAHFFMYRHDMMFEIEKACDKDLCIIVSMRGETKDLIDACSIAKENHSYTISMTHLSKNTIAEMCDMNLFFWAPESTINNYNVTDRTGLMILIRTLSEFLWKC